MVGKMMCMIELCGCCLFLLKKMQYTFSECYNKMAMEKIRRRGGGANKKLHKTSTCTQMGQGIMPNTVRESQAISFVKFSANV